MQKKKFVKSVIKNSIWIGAFVKLVLGGIYSIAETAIGTNN